MEKNTKRTDLIIKSQRLNQLIKQKGFESASSFAKAIQEDRSTVYNWLHGINWFKEDKYVKIANALNVSEDVIRLIGSSTNDSQVNQTMINTGVIHKVVARNDGESFSICENTNQVKENGSEDSKVLKDYIKMLKTLDEMDKLKEVSPADFFQFMCKA